MLLMSLQNLENQQGQNANKKKQWQQRKCSKLKSGLYWIQIQMLALSLMSVEFASDMAM